MWHRTQAQLYPYITHFIPIYNIFYTNTCITAKKENGTYVGLCFLHTVFTMSETGTPLIKLSCCQSLSQEGRASTGSLSFFWFQNTYVIPCVCLCSCMRGNIYSEMKETPVNAWYFCLTSGWACHNQVYVPDLDPSGKTKLTTSWFSLCQQRFPNIDRPYLLSFHPTPLFNLAEFWWLNHFPLCFSDFFPNLLLLKDA